MVPDYSQIRGMSGYGKGLSPQMRSALGPIFGADIIHEKVVSEINIAGLPGGTVPPVTVNLEHHST